MRQAVLAAIAAVLLVFPAPAQEADEAREPSELEAALYKEINRVRAAAGAGPVYRDIGFEELARGHAEDMAARGYQSHVSPDGDGVRERLMGRFPDYIGAVGENIAVRGIRRNRTAEQRAAAAVDSWLDSPPHRENMLNPRHNWVGIGEAQDARVLLLVTLFGSETSGLPDPSAPLPEPEAADDAPEQDGEAGGGAAEPAENSGSPASGT